MFYTSATFRGVFAVFLFGGVLLIFLSIQATLTLTKLSVNPKRKKKARK